MEPVPALRQHSDFVSSDEFSQADSAVRWISGGLGGVGNLREGSEDFLLQAFVGRSLRSGTVREVRCAGDPAEPGAASYCNEAED